MGNLTTKPKNWDNRCSIPFWGQCPPPFFSKTFQRLSPNLIFEIKIKYPFRFSLFIFFFWDTVPYRKIGKKLKKKERLQRDFVPEKAEMQYSSIHFCLCVCMVHGKRSIPTEESEHEWERLREGRAGCGRNLADAARPGSVHFINNGGSVVASGLGSTRREKEGGWWHDPLAEPPSLKSNPLQLSISESP